MPRHAAAEGAALVFLLNRYFRMVGETVEQSGGSLIQFTGDGAMALFGVEVEPSVACRQALNASIVMLEKLVALNQSLEEELDAPLKMGIGIHQGPAVVGRMGYGPVLTLTAVGATINVASRLQDLTKDYHCQLVVSDAVGQQAGIDLSSFPREELTVRNRKERIIVRTIVDDRELAQKVGSASP